MESIAVIEEAIVARLTEKTGLPARSFPDDPREFKLAHPRGVCLVHYGGSTFADPLTADVIIQERTISFDVVTVFRGLRGSAAQAGAYAALDLARLALTGFRPPGCGKMRPQKEEFLTEDAGVWQYGLTFVMDAPHVEASGEEVGAPLKHITVVDDFETRVIEKGG